MTTSIQNRREPLGLFPDKSAPRLYDRIVAVLRVRHYSQRTEEAYLHWIRRFIEFHGHQHPRQLAEDDANRFLTHLAVKEHVSAATQNQALSAILFLYEHVLEQPLDRIEGVVRARRPKRLPVVLTVDEISRVMSHLSGDKWLIAMLLYGGGLRLLESLRLRVKDLDFERGEITIRQGKKGTKTELQCCRGRSTGHCRSISGALKRFTSRTWQTAAAESSYHTPWPASIRMQTASGVGNSCSRRRIVG
jgi:integrase